MTLRPRIVCEPEGFPSKFRCKLLQYGHRLRQPLLAQSVEQLINSFRRIAQRRTLVADTAQRRRLVEIEEVGDEVVGVLRLDSVWIERPVWKVLEVERHYDVGTTLRIFFVAARTQPGAPGFVPPAERITVFDNDGTLWAEQPMYFQALFAMDRVRAIAPQHPEWKEKQPFKGVLEDDIKAVAAAGEHGLIEMVMATHAGMTTEEFERTVSDWITTAKHPKSGKLCTEMVYQPMLELLAYLRGNGFKTFIVSGGGIEFMRPLGRTRLRHPSRTGHRQQHQNEVCPARWQPRAHAPARSQLL